MLEQQQQQLGRGLIYSFCMYDVLYTRGVSTWCDRETSEILIGRTWLSLSTRDFVYLYGIKYPLAPSERRWWWARSFLCVCIAQFVTERDVCFSVSPRHLLIVATGCSPTLGEQFSERKNNTRNRHHAVFFSLKVFFLFVCCSCRELPKFLFWLRSLHGPGCRMGAMGHSRVLCGNAGWERCQCRPIVCPLLLSFFGFSGKKSSGEREREWSHLWRVLTFSSCCFLPLLLACWNKSREPTDPWLYI